MAKVKPDTGLTASQARDLLRYEPETGKLFWRVKRGRVPAGSEAGTVWSTPKSESVRYRDIRTGGRGYRAHRLAWLILYGEWPPGEIDHINGDGLDNRLSNLRVVSAQENKQNAARRRDNPTGVTGVYWRAPINKWSAYINTAGKRVHLGVFENFADAVSVRKAAEREYGFHQNHGREAVYAS